MAEAAYLNPGPHMDYSAQNPMARKLSILCISHFFSLAAESRGSPNPPEANSERREVGDLAVWTLSSAKQGNGVEQIRDNNTNTFWQ